MLSIDSITTLQLVDPAVLSDPHYWAHTQRKSMAGGKDGLKTETLLAHSRLTLHYYKVYCQKKSMEKVVHNLIEACGFGKEEGQIVYLLFLYAIYLHDLGKINPAYQAKVLENEYFCNQYSKGENSQHSLAGAYLYIDHMYKVVLKNPSEGVCKCLAAFAYCISRHHGKLGNGKGFSELASWNERYFRSELDPEVFDRIEYDMQQTLHGRTQGNEPLAFYILGRLLYALITGCDYCATQEFMTGQIVEPAVIGECGVGLKERYDESTLCRSIRSCQKDPASFRGDPINELRTQIFLKAEENLLAQPEAHIYYLEAPTGAGKTNMAINLTLRMLEVDQKIRNIVYVFPFNTLVEQTKETLESYFGKQLAVVNSLTPVLMGEEEKEENYDEAWLDHLFHNYPIVLTSHVNFFNALFGCGRNQCFPLLKLCHSVIVLDEIQSYKNEIWREMISFLQCYAKLLHIKIIIMSATLPQLDRMLRTVDAQFATLIDDPSNYYQDPLFQERVHLDFSLLEQRQEKITLEELKERVLAFKGRRVLVEFINKRTAQDFYELCKEECNAVLLTGDDNGARRKQVIDRIQQGERMILIATQVIEAGVNIDMEIGFKDISLPDGEEQFLGRINRSCLLKDGGVAYFFDYDDAKTIYRGDARLQYSIMDPAIRKNLQEKSFDKIYEQVFAELLARTSKANGRNIAYLDQDCVQLNCQNVEKKMKLIEPTHQMFIPYQWEELDGYQVWEEFKELCCNREMSYTQRKVELSRLALTMSYFTFTAYDDKKLLGAESFGGYFFIEGGEQFVENGILDRKALEKYFGGVIW